MRLFLRIVIVIALVLLALVAGGIAWLASPGEPGAAASLKFHGYVLLPSHGVLNVLDYMNVDGRTLFVSGASAGSVFELPLDRDGNAQNVREFRGSPRTHGIVRVSDDLAFVTRSGEDTVDAFSPSSLKLISRIAVADDPDGAIYDARDHFVYLANGDAGAGTLIDTGTRTRVAQITLGGKPEFAAYDPASGLIYQNLVSTNALVAIAPARRAIARRWTLPGCVGPTGIAVDTQAHRLFIVCGRNAMLIVFDPSRGRVVAQVAIGGGPDAVAFDFGLHRIYATGLTGYVSVVQQEGADRYRLLDLMATHFAAHTLAVDPVSHRLFVGYASLIVPPRVAVFSPVK